LVERDFEVQQKVLNFKITLFQVHLSGRPERWTWESPSAKFSSPVLERSTWQRVILKYTSPDFLQFASIFIGFQC